jgi:hypothetical protein
MDKAGAIKIFENKKVRTLWDDQQEKWYFSVIDVIEVLTDSPRPRKYWHALKTKLASDGSELSQNMGQLMQAVNSKTFAESQKVARQGGNVAKVARLELEAKTGKKVVSPLNVKQALTEKNKKEDSDG